MDSVVLGAAIALPLTDARAEGPAIIRPGDAVVTGFSGAKVWGEFPSGVLPIDRTFIDTSGAVLQVFDLTKLGGPLGAQIANAPATYRAIAGEVGQVFGVALDSDPASKTTNIYVGATSLFGLQIVSAEGARLVKGEPGAQWMPGHLVLVRGRARSGRSTAPPALSRSSPISCTTARTTRAPASGGWPTILTPTNSATDLEFGLIDRLGGDGQDRGTFDHGVSGRKAGGLDAISYDASSRASIQRPEFDIEDPFTWGFADARRLVFAVAVANKRLDYSVEKPLQIRSVGINADGSFADDPRLEIEVTGSPTANSVTASPSTARTSFISRSAATSPAATIIPSSPSCRTRSYAATPGARAKALVGGCR